MKAVYVNLKIDRSKVSPSRSYVKQLRCNGAQTQDQTFSLYAMYTYISQGTLLVQGEFETK